MDPAIAEWLRDYRRPPGTIALIAFICLVFLGQLAIGHGDSSAAVPYMGGVWGPSVRQGAVWDLFAAAFLHFGIVHIAMNMFALFSLGQLLESVIGWQRVVLAFFVSAFVGNLLAVFAPNALSAGASGGIWGLMTLAGALVVRRPDVFPGQLATNLRPRLMRALLINGAISFIPGVSWLAHMGGGVAGALLGFSGALTFNVLRFPVPPARPLWLTLTTIGVTLVAVLCLLFATFVGLLARAHGA